MVVKINGSPILEGAHDEAICSEIIRNAPKLRRIAITWWITAGALLVSSKRAMAATTSSTDSTSDQLMSSFQDLVIKFGAVAIVVGLILLVVKKKAGVKTLKMTAFITGGVFLAPTVILLVAILAYSINDNLYATFQQMRAHMHHQ